MMNSVLSSAYAVLRTLLVVCCLGNLSNAQTTNKSQIDRAVQQRLAAELPRVLAKNPEQAQETFRLLDGFRMELVAPELIVTDPVAVKYDENGLAYVAEMGDYPYSDKSHDRPYAEQTSLPLGRVRVLEDTDGDGRFDKSTILADKISWPTGLTHWKGGVFGTCTPDIIYLKDTDGDGKVDIHHTVFTGFPKYSVQSVINNLQWGLDHRIYGAVSDNGCDIRRADDADAKPVNMRRSDY